MKIRKGFVSNSSSSSFINVFDGDKTIEQCEKLIEETYDGLDKKEVEDLAQKLFDLLEPYDIENHSEWDGLVISKSKQDLYAQCNKTLLDVELEDGSYDNGFICPSNENYYCLEYEWQDNRPENVIDYCNNH